MRPGAKITEHQILAKEMGRDNSWGAIDGELQPGTCAFLRPGTNAREGNIFMYGGARSKSFSSDGVEGAGAASFERREDPAVCAPSAHQGGGDSQEPFEIGIGAMAGHP